MCLKPVVSLIAQENWVWMWIQIYWIFLMLSSKISLFILVTNMPEIIILSSIICTVHLGWLMPEPSLRLETKHGPSFLDWLQTFDCDYIIKITRKIILSYQSKIEIMGDIFKFIVRKSGNFAMILNFQRRWV